MSDETKSVCEAFENLGGAAVEAAKSMAAFAVSLAVGSLAKEVRLRKAFIPDKRVLKRGKRGRQGVRMELLRYKGEQT